MRPLLILIALIPLVFSCNNEKPKQESQITTEEETAPLAAAHRFPYMLQYAVGPEAFPRSLEPNGEVRGVPSKDWTSGFFPGSLMYIHQLTDDQSYLAKAEEWLPLLEQEKLNNRTHDMGFKVYCSYGNAYKLTGNQKYAEVIVESAQTLITRYNPTIGCIKSWDFGGDRWIFPVIIDNMMNLELLFEATKISGDSTFHKIADSHVSVTLKNHFRSDFSSYHVIDYDPETGEVRNRLTHQGLNKESSWARGQAWGLYGFTMAYRYTANQAYLTRAKEIAEFVFTNKNMPADLIAYWDFDDPKIPNSPRDASAAAVMASALLELAEYAPEQKDVYLDRANTIINTLSSDEYLLAADNTTPFILAHSTGNMPKNDEVDAPISYADYYYLEAILRSKNFDN
ncbi:MAG: glycoside hydrolase family 88 protein [Cyclobacteriaceae bacterium]